MKKVTTKVLYVFSFSLLFTALYLNFVQKDKDATFLRSEKKVTLGAVATETSAVAQPENNTVLR